MIFGVSFWAKANKTSDELKGSLSFLTHELMDFENTVQSSIICTCWSPIFELFAMVPIARLHPFASEHLSVLSHVVPRSYPMGN